MTIYLGLGANDGNRKHNLERAIAELVGAGFRLERVSPVVESPALLPDDADPAWHKPYLNLVISGDADWQPHEGLAAAKRIEQALGRGRGARWSPRPIDIDLLRWHDCITNDPADNDPAERTDNDPAERTDNDLTATGKLTIPHADARRRDFVLTPLLHLQPDLPVGERGETVFELTRTIRPIPLWMAIVNLTPDSFSDGGEWADAKELQAHLDNLIEHNAHIIDLGAESTRPGGQPLPAAEEWARLEPVLAALAERLRGRYVKPWLSVDSRNPATIEKALGYGVDMINDVTGLGDPEMMAVARQNGCQVVAMHSLSVPVDPALMLPDDRGAVGQILRWAEDKMETWTKAGLDLNRIILDPGIGFGKTTTQAFDLLRHCRELRRTGLRLLVGHSRKSFMSGLTDRDRPAACRDLETLGMSLALCAQGVDVLRVHAPLSQMRAALAWAHIAPPPPAPPAPE